MSKLSIHSLIGPKKGAREYSAIITRAGENSHGKCVDDYGLAWEAEGVADYFEVDHIWVGRVNTAKDKTGRTVDLQAIEPRGMWVGPQGAKAAADSYLDIVEPIWERNPQITIWETFNEFSYHWQWQGWFYNFIMERVDRQQRFDYMRLCHFAFSSGNPPLGEEIDQIVRTGVIRETAARGHFLSFHEYGGVGNKSPSVPNPLTLRGTDPWHALRHRKFYDLLRYGASTGDYKLTALPQCIISELGYDGGFTAWPTVEAMADDLNWYADEIAKDPEVYFATVWTVGKYRKSNIQGDPLLWLARHIAESARPQPAIVPGGIAIIPPVEPDPDPDPDPVLDYVATVNLAPQDLTRKERAAIGELIHDKRQDFTQSADTARAIVSLAMPGSSVKLWDDLETRYPPGIHEYLGVPIEFKQIPLVDPPPPPPPPEDEMVRGVPLYLHLDARSSDPNRKDGSFEDDIQLMRDTQADGFKMLSSSPINPDALAIMLQQTGTKPEDVILRFIMPGTDSNKKDPDKWFELFREQMDRAYVLGVYKWEISNEENLCRAMVDAGQISEDEMEWDGTAEEFAAWFGVVASRICLGRNFPRVKIVFGGLSPQENTEAWYHACYPVIYEHADYVGIHCYFSNRTPEFAPDALQGGRYWEQVLGWIPDDILCLITEFTDNSDPTFSTPEARAGRTMQFVNSEFSDRIEAITLYITRDENHPGQELKSNPVLVNALAGRIRPGDDVPPPDPARFLSSMLSRNENELVITSPFLAPRATYDHAAIDIRAPQGSPLYAPCDMVIAGVFGTTNDGAYGCHVWADVIENGESHGIMLLFAHLSDIDEGLEAGHFVGRGGMFAKTGGAKDDPCAGNSTGAHLHFGVLDENADNVIRGQRRKGWQDPAPLFLDSVKIRNA